MLACGTTQVRLPQAEEFTRCQTRKPSSWTGKSGTNYTYYIYPIGETFKHLPGNYIFAKETSPNTFNPIYIGKAQDLGARIANHNEGPCINRNGGTHVHTDLNQDGQDARRAKNRTC